MAATLLPDITTAMKTEFLPMIVEGINREKPPIFKLFKDGAKTVEWNNPKQAEQLIRLQGLESYSSQKEMTVIPSATKRTYEKYILNMKYTSGRVEMSAQSMNIKEGSGSWVNEMTEQLNGLKELQVVEQSRTLYGAGNGILCRVNGALSSGATTTVVDDQLGYTGANMGNKFIRPGMFVAYINASTGALITSVEVLTVNRTTGLSFTHAALTVAVADNSVIVRGPSATNTDVNATSFNNDPDGIGAFFDDGTNSATYKGVTRTSHPAFQSYIKNAFGALSVEALQEVHDYVQGISGKTIDTYLTSPSIRRAFLALINTNYRYNFTPGQASEKPADIGPNTLKEGEYLTFGGIKIMSDKYCPERLYLFDSSLAYKFVWKDGEFAEETGSMWRPITSPSDVDGYFAVYRSWYENHYELASAAAVLSGVTSTAVNIPILN